MNIHEAISTLLGCGLILASAAVFPEDVASAISKCGASKDDRQRLACYDHIRDGVIPQLNAKSVGYQPIGLVDLKVDLKDLVGKHLVVPALIQVMGELSFLKSDEMDMTPIWANASGLPRDDRKKLASGCQMLLCKGRFFGVVKSTSMGLGLVIEKVDWQ